MQFPLSSGDQGHASPFSLSVSLPSGKYVDRKVGVDKDMDIRESGGQEQR